MREVRRAFEPHFEIAEISHRDCRVLVPLALAVEPLSVLASIVALGVLALMGLLQGPLVYFVAAAALWGVARFARWARGKLRERFEANLSRVGAGIPVPHLVAHGFGTYLAVQAIRFPGRRLHNVILAGAMLPSRFDWETLFGGNPGAFQRLRNDFGRGGEWPWMSYLSWPLCPELGFAGIHGFRAPLNGTPASVWVYHAGVDGKCQSCVVPPAGPSVQNVRLQVSTRSDRFIRFPYASVYWRPFLWGIAPHEYLAFLDLCQDAARMYRNDRNDPGLSMYFEEFGESVWGFLGERTMSDAIEKRAPGKSKAWKENCYTRMWMLVTAAQEREQQAESGSPPGLDTPNLDVLKPQAAIQKVVEHFLSKGNLV
jgi:hypothetical protein